jgi:hypothetical protein
VIGTTDFVRGFIAEMEDSGILFDTGVLTAAITPAAVL